jgi:hypothetical protein
MKKIEFNPKFTKDVEEYAFKYLKTRSIAIAPLAEISTKDNKFMLVSIGNKEKANAVPLSLVLDKEGKIATLEEAKKNFAVDFFAPTKIEILPWIRPRGTTITPNVNNLILNLCDKFGERLIVDIPKNPTRNVDIYFLADTTGSMGTAVDAVKAQVGDIMTNIGTITGINVAYGAGNYRDFNSGDPFVFQNNISITASNNAAVTAAVGTWALGNGGDTPEGQLFALTQVADTAVVGWRSNSLKIAVWFGDQPGHDPICASIYGGTTNITEITTTTKLTTEKVRVLAISVGSGAGLDADPNAGASDYGTCTPAGTAGQAKRITAATGGSHLVGVNSTDIANAIITMIQNSLQTINNVSLVPSADIIPFICSINPKSGYSNLDASKDNRLEFIVCFRGVVACKEKDQVFKGTLDVVLDSNVVATKKVLIEVPACKSKGKCQCGCCD